MSPGIWSSGCRRASAIAATPARPSAWAPLAPLALAVALALSATIATAGPVIREAGALYPEDAIDEPVKLRVLAEAPIHFDSAGERYLGHLTAGQRVELQAIKGDRYRVKGRARQGQVAGWVAAAMLEPLPADFVAQLAEAIKRKEEVAALIAGHEVALNMTCAEVQKSLGKPHQRTANTDAEGTSEVWEYVTYQVVPQQVTHRDWWGQLYTETRYVKVPVGQRAVVFKDGMVAAMEETEGSLARQARLKLLAEPLEIGPVP